MRLGAGLGFGSLNVDAGAAGGVLQTMQQMEVTLGLAILVTIFGSGTHNAAQHGATPQHALMSGMTRVFTVSLLLAACTLSVALTFRRTT
jgi:hypothetical protein